MYRQINKACILTFIPVVVSTLALTSMALAAEFSADYIMHLPGPNGRISIPGKIYIKGHMERKVIGKSTNQMVIITRPDKGVLWSLDPARKSCATQQIPDLKSNPTLLERLRKMHDFKKAGSAKIAGYLCDKFTYSDTASNKPCVAYISPQLKHELKTEVSTLGGNATFEFKT